SFFRRGPMNRLALRNRGQGHLGLLGAGMKDSSHKAGDPEQRREGRGDYRPPINHRLTTRLSRHDCAPSTHDIGIRTGLVVPRGSASLSLAKQSAPEIRWRRERILLAW